MSHTSRVTRELWTAVDDYIDGLFVPPDAALDAALADARAAGLPPINVAPNQGKLLMLLAKAVGARRILEIGTLAGYSTIWLARALPADGVVITLEADPRHAEVARANLARAGCGNVEVRLGDAAETLPTLEDEAPFDLVFIDADKEGYPTYFDWSMRLSRPGTLIVADNVIRAGGVVDPDTDDARVLGVRRFNELVAADPRVSATAVQTVGSKGHDGFTLAVVRET